ncbi:MAG TPA: twin-arginine translocation signal domain-containing protein, partial [Gemmatimonadetes bacterium]|nr:twin-arginine translocation signal domain-containing protein [Gemmatimonadota bacterium]
MRPLDAKGESRQSRRDFLMTAGAAASGLVLAPALLS